MPSASKAMVFPYEDKLIFTYILLALALLANILLIVLSVATKNSQIGAYRILLQTFAIVDMVISLFHAVVIPEVHAIPYAFICFGRRSLGSHPLLEMVIIFLYLMFYYQSFILLCFHFVYRMLVLKEPTHWSKRLSFSQWVAVAIGVDILYTSVVFYVCFWFSTFLGHNELAERKFRDIIMELYGVDIRHSGYFGIIYAEETANGLVWNVRNIITEVSGIAWYSLYFSIVPYCIYETRKAIRTIRMSEHTRLLQKQLLRALVLQTLTPAILTYIPLAVSILLPVSGIDLSLVSNFTFSCTFIFPALDPILIIAFVKQYRMTLSRWFKCYRPRVSSLTPVSDFSIFAQRHSHLAHSDPSTRSIVPRDESGKVDV